MHKPGSTGLLLATMFPQTIMSMVVLTPPVVADQLTMAVNLPVEAAGFYTTLNYFFIAVGTLLSGALIPKLGPLRLSFLCVICGGCALALLGIASVLSVLVATACMGMCYGPLTPSSLQAIANQGTTTNLALFLSIRQTAVPLGGILAGVVVPPLVVWLHLPMALLIVGIAVTLSGLFMGLTLRIVRSEIPPQRFTGVVGFFGPLRYMLQNRDLVRLSFGSTVYGAMQLTVSSLLVVFLMTVLGRDLIAAGLLLGVSQIGAVIGRIGWGFVADRLSALRLTLVAVGIGMSLSCILIGLLPPGTPNWLIAIIVFILGGTTSGWNGVFLTTLIRAVPSDQAGFAASGALLFSYLGIIFGPPLFGTLALYIGFSNAFFIFAVVAFGGSMLCMPARSGVEL